MFLIIKTCVLQIYNIFINIFITLYKQNKWIFMSIFINSFNGFMLPSLSFHLILDTVMMTIMMSFSTGLYNSRTRVTLKTTRDWPRFDFFFFPCLTSLFLYLRPALNPPSPSSLDFSADWTYKTCTRSCRRTN